MMQSKQKQSRSPVYWLALGLVLFSSQACSEGGGKVTLPDKTQMVLVVGLDGNVTVLDAKGNPAPKCQLCTQELESKYGPYCKDAQAKDNICAGLTGVTVQNVNNITLISSHKNPYCLCRVVGGSAYCLPVGCNSKQ